jgi:hypothetical protein
VVIDDAAERAGAVAEELGLDQPLGELIDGQEALRVRLLTGVTIGLTGGV